MCALNITTVTGQPLQDGARLQALSAKHTYKALLRLHTKGVTPILHQEPLDDAKAKVEAAAGLRPTNEKLLKRSESPQRPTSL